MTMLLLFALAAAVVAIVMLLIRHAVYRSTHGYTARDIASARRDSLARSRNVVSGTVQEHLVPFCPEFLGVFNPRDGSVPRLADRLHRLQRPDEGAACREVVLVEVKTVTSPLSKRERQVRDAVEAGRVSWTVIRLTAPRQNELAGEVETSEAVPQAAPALGPPRSASFAPGESDSLKEPDRRSRCESRPLPPKAVRTIIL